MASLVHKKNSSTVTMDQWVGRVSRDRTGHWRWIFTNDYDGRERRSDQGWLYREDCVESMIKSMIEKVSSEGKDLYLLDGKMGEQQELL